MPSILALGMNPAYQKSLIFEDLRMDDVNRAKTMNMTVGGKGQTFAKAVRNLDLSSTVLAQFVGGYTGSWIQNKIKKQIKDVPNQDILDISVITKAQTRTCTTLLCQKTKSMTELIDPSGNISSGELEQMIYRINDCITNKNIQAIAICGTVPGNVPPSFYANIVRNKPSNCFVLLDSYKNVRETLETQMVDILKINIQELFKLTKSIIPKATPSTVSGCVNTCFNVFSLKYIALTNGSKEAFLYENDQKKCFRYSIPSINVINPIGAGDTVAAVFVYYLITYPNLHASQAFKYGLAAGCASCKNINGAEFTLDEMNDMYKRIEINVLNNCMESNSLSSKM